jgi:hypothetical protein
LIAQNRISVSDIKEISFSLMLFASGVAAACAGMGATYFTTLYHGTSEASHILAWEHPYTKPDASHKNWRRAAMVFQFLAVGFGLASLILFVVGMVDVREAISALKPLSPASPSH